MNGHYSVVNPFVVDFIIMCLDIIMQGTERFVCIFSVFCFTVLLAHWQHVCPNKLCNM